MQICKWCGDSKTQEDFYSLTRSVCKPCLREYNYQYNVTIPVFPKPKGYQDYLKAADMEGYAKRYLKNFT